MTKALAGLKLLDVSRVLTGPYSTMVLADLGADVIKVEVPGRGDDSRLFGPFANGESGYYMTLNRNKRGITLDLRRPEGQAVLKDLARWADVLLENFATGTMAGWGLGYEDLAAVNPRLIYASITGFGQYGPNSGRYAFDAIAQATGGLMSITGAKGGPPTRVGTALGDINAGNFATIGILAALYQRERTGRGQRIDISMQDCIAAILENAVVRYTIDGDIPTRLGSSHANVSPYDVFAASDGHVFIACANEATWRRLCKAMDREDLVTDARFEINAKRAENIDTLTEIINRWSSRFTAGELLAVLETNGVPGAQVLSVDQVVGDPHIRARNMMVAVDHPVAGTITIPGNPVKMSASDDTIERPAPVLGQHTDQVLAELGYSADKIAALKAAKIV
ncbi:CaiB/BaiF CoA transferase family protein [Anaeroselena agilis]|uniref:CaiB/BaiF CoA-transferase family protein n=1 Tax=Anaeroselena agilis TaxID=3063788 RepID=A0ABU3P0C2_9FIRM|nr:CaiB/BaiF CoA-transferase family protein [Selenomonadales bacterium 4137-cl]